MRKHSARIGWSTALLVPLFFSVLTGLCLAEQLAVVPQGGNTTSDPRPFMIGWQFRVDNPWIVSGLAYFDVGSDGLGESHQVGIFDSGSGVLLVSATIPAGTGASLMDGFRVVPVSYALGAGTYVIGGQTSSSADGGLLLATSTLSVAGISYLQERELSTSSFVMPTNNSPNSEIGIFGPDFTVASAIPEPSTMLLLGSGLLGLAILRKKFFKK